MVNTFESKVIAKSPVNHARVMKVTTPHGDFMTPAFMAVGTRAVVNHMTPHDLISAGSQIILGGNTYHMLCSPGMEFIQAAGGMHRMMAWDRPMLTDSGGYQVLSLSKNKEICRIDEEGARFKHPINGNLIRLNPEISIKTQKIIGADIIMAFDQCTPEEGGRTEALAAMARTHRWLQQSKEAHLKEPCSVYGFHQALFGIIQGGSFRDLREQSAQFVLSQACDGIAIGGEVIGFNMPKTVEVVDWLRPMLPAEKVRYTMGVGLSPQDLIDVVASGIDIFDCVAPTRNARHGSLYCGNIHIENNWLHFEGEDRGRILIKKSIYARDHSPIMEGCDCYTCQHYSRAYLHFLFKEKSAAFSHLACIHNVSVMNKVCEVMRGLMMC